MQGESIVPLLQGKKPKDWRKSLYYHYYEFPYWHHVQPHYGIRTQKYTLAHFYYNIDVWELYDLEKDPHEMKDIIKEKGSGKLARKLFARLLELQVETGDTLDLRKAYPKLAAGS